MCTLRYSFHGLQVLILILIVNLFTSSCSSTSNALVEGPPAYQPSPVAPTAAVKMPSVIAPKLPEVQEAVRRVFKDSADIDSSSQPSFFTGDFNGDASQDLAVILNPAPGKLSSLNEEYPAWLLRDPFSIQRQDKTSLNIEERDVLLAVIHGYGDNDWRDSQATQTFVLKNAVGSNITVKTGKDFSREHSGRKLPRPQGDLIGETLRGTNGYLYFASANYQWYDPKSFKPRADVGMIHGSR